MSDATVQTNIDITATDRTGQALSSVADNLRKVNAAANGALAGSLNKSADAAKKTGDAVAEHIGRRSTEALNGASVAAGAFLERLTGIPLGMAAAGVAVEEMARRSFESFATIQRGMESIQFGTGATRQQMQALGAQFDEMAVSTGRSVEQLQGDFGAFLASSGLGIEDAAKAFKDIGIAATVTGTSLEAMGRAAGAAFANLRIQSDADRQAVLGAWAKEIPTSLMDAWTQVAPRLTQEMATMGFSGKQAAIDMAGMFQQVAASLGSTRLAATSLSEVMAKMSSLSDPLGQVMLPTLERIREQGGSSLDAMKALVDQLQQAGAFTSNLVQRASIRQAFGIDEQTLHSLQVLRDHFADIQKIVNSTGESWQEATKQYELRSNDAMGAINRLTAAFDDLESQFGELLDQMGASTALRAVADLLNDMRATVEAIVNTLQGHPILGLEELGRAAGNAVAPDLVTGPKAGQYDPPPAQHHTVPTELLPENVPHFAGGGVVDKPTLAVVGDAGPEAMVPLAGGFGSTATPKGTKQATEDNTSAINRLSAYLRDWFEGRGSGLAFTPGAGGAATPAIAGLLPHWTAGGAGGVYASLGGGGGGADPMIGSPAPGGVIMPGGGIARGPQVRPEGVVPKSAGGVPPSAPRGGGSREQTAMRYFMSQGWSRDQAAGIVSNLEHESGLRPGSVGDSGLAHGLAQWHPDRRARIARAFGKPVERMSYEEQLAAVQWELTHSEHAAGDALHRAHSAEQAGAAISELYERPLNVRGEAMARARTAATIAARTNVEPAHAGSHWTVDDINKALTAHRKMREEMEKPIHTSIAEPKRPPLYSQRRRIAGREARWRNEAMLEQTRYASQADLGVS